MIIELYGLPGAGKSTLAKELGEKFGVPVIRLLLLDRLRWWGIALLRDPKATVQGIRFLFQHAEGSLYSLFMNGCIDRYAKWEKAKNIGGIVDEGPLQNTLSFPCREFSQEEIRRMVDGLPKSDLVVVVSASRDERKSRQEARGRVVRDDAWEEYAQVNISRVINVLREEGRNVVFYPEMSLDDIVAKHP